MGRSTSTSASKNDLLIPVLVGLLVFLMAARAPLDSDLFWHLRAGETTLGSLRPLLSDTMSYTRVGVAWINHSWLGQVLLALIYNGTGFLGLSTLVALCAAAMMLGIYSLMKGPPLWRAFVVVLACLVVAPLWTPRPQLFSLLLLVGLEILLTRWRAGKARLVWVIPLFVVWSNLHGGYPLGLILIACWIAGELLNRLTGQEALGMRRLGQLALAGLAGWLAVALNPNGTAMWAIPFQTLGVGALQQAIPEWASPDFHDLVQQPFLWMLAALLGAFGLSGRRVEGKALVKVVVFAAMGLVARRNFGPFGLLAAPVLAEMGWLVLERLAGRIPSGAAGSARPLSIRLQTALNLGIILLVGTAALIKLFAVNQPALLETYTRQNYPAGAVAWLRQEHPQGRLFSSYAWGGYLDWAVPEYPVFIDGRTDLFGDEVIGEWLRIDGVESGWEESLARWQVRLVLLPPGHPLGKALEQSGWRTRYHDETAVVYER